MGCAVWVPVCSQYACSHAHISSGCPSIDPQIEMLNCAPALRKAANISCGAMVASVYVSSSPDSLQTVNGSSYC
eukprot:510906-Alexandrium_andersonii.AAC.1